MNKIELKNKTFIEGFDDIALWNQKICYLGQVSEKDIELLYSGKTSEIPEELAKECVNTIPHYFYGMRIVDTDGNDVLFKNYKINKFVKRSGKRSIQSACPNEFCIIYKTSKDVSI